MSKSRIIAQPYAEALIELANVEGMVANIAQDLLDISELLSSSRPLKLFLVNPVISKKSKKFALNQLLKEQVHNLVITFLYFLIDKHRITLLDDIIPYYVKLSNELEQTTIVYLKTAQVLTSEQYNLLENKLLSMTKTKTIKIKTQVDSNLIAGLVLQIGSKIIDTSLRGQLQSMADHLNTTNVLT